MGQQVYFAAEGNAASNRYQQQEIISLEIPFNVVYLKVPFIKVIRLICFTHPFCP